MRTQKNLGFGYGFGFETQNHKPISIGFETHNPSQTRNPIFFEFSCMKYISLTIL